MSLLDNLKSSQNGLAWFEILGDDCIASLGRIDKFLTPLWNVNKCYPSKPNVFNPFHMISPKDTKLVIICKQPYASQIMATGIPVETNLENITPSGIYFKRIISAYWSNVDDQNFMKCYYSSGILVINASFTIQKSLDKRYSMTDSHFPLWSTFTKRLVLLLVSLNIPIVFLGLEAKALSRNVESKASLYHSAFPNDETTFTEFAKELCFAIEENIFDVSRNVEYVAQQDKSTY